MSSRPTSYEYHKKGKAVATEVVVAPTDELAKAVAEEVKQPDPVNAQEVIAKEEVVVPPTPEPTPEPVVEPTPAPEPAPVVEEPKNESGNDTVVHDENSETPVAEPTV